MNTDTKGSRYGLKSKIAALALAGILLPMATDEPVSVEAQETKAATPKRAKTKYPQIVNTTPAIGATDVKTSLKRISVTFDRDMARGMSWTGGPPLFPPTDKSSKAKWINKRTCVLPVKLARGKFYRVGINAKSFQNFKSADGVAVPPTAIFLATEGASAETKAKAAIPKIVKIDPANRAIDVAPSLEEISVTFNIPMGEGMSWTGGGPKFPESPNGTRASWSSDRKTCTLPVKLVANHIYRLGLNSLSHRNFQSESGIPLEPVVYQFKTK